MRRPSQRGVGGRHVERRHRHGGRVARVRSGQRGEDVPSLAHGARHRSDLIERRSVRDEAVARDAPVRGLHADDAAERRRLPDGAAGVRSERHRHRAGRHERRGAAARAAWRAGLVPGVEHGAKGGVLVRRPHRELVAVGLGDDHRASRVESLHDGRVVRRDEAIEDARAGGGARAARADVVLDRHRHAGQREPRAFVVGERVHGRGALTRTLRGDGQDGVEPRRPRRAPRGRRHRRARPPRVPVGTQVDRAHAPITRGTRNKPAFSLASVALASASRTSSEGRGSSAAGLRRPRRCGR